MLGGKINDVPLNLNVKREKVSLQIQGVLATLSLPLTSCTEVTMGRGIAFVTQT